MQTKSLKGSDFIAISDFTKEEIDTILDTAFELKLERARGQHHHLLEDQTIYMMFYNKSLRTRNSFETGIHQLGGHGIYLDSNTVYTPQDRGRRTGLRDRARRRRRQGPLALRRGHLHPRLRRPGELDARPGQRLHPRLRQGG